ncbi:MAG: hypothetical protein WC346_22470 [Methanogenium sp.]
MIKMTPESNVIDTNSHDIELLIDRISSIAYDDNLKTTLVVKSINCREWEKEKSIFERYKFPDEYLSNSDIKKLASRYYVEIRSQKTTYNEHIHFGHFDFRPTSATICDAFLPIPEKNGFFVTCKKAYKSDDFENPTISTVPYTMPDIKLGACAPSSLWIILTTLANELGLQYYSLSDIALNLPKNSLSKNGIRDFEAVIKKMNFEYYYHYGIPQRDEYQEIEKKIQTKSECKGDCKLSKLFAHIHTDSKNMSLMDSDTLYAYIESEIPVYLVFDFESLLLLPTYSKWKKSEECSPTEKDKEKYHAIVAVGHTLNKNGEHPDFIVHDVDLAPFIVIPQEFINKHLLEALVLLPENTVHYTFIKKIFEEKILPNFLKIDKHLDSLSPIDELKIRPFLMRSQRIKFWFSNKLKYPEEITQIFSVAEFPKYVWVFEFSNSKTREKNQSLGHIIFNASVSAKQSSPVLITSPNYLLWYENGELRDSSKDNPDSFYFGLSLFRCKG